MITEEQARQQGVRWIPQEEYDKALGQLRLQLNGVFTPFHGYGHDVFIPQAADEALKLAEDFCLRVRGAEKPVSLDIVRRNGRKYGR
jgi:hypothetical protein